MTIFSEQFLNLPGSYTRLLTARRRGSDTFSECTLIRKRRQYVHMAFSRYGGMPL